MQHTTAQNVPSPDTPSFHHTPSCSQIQSTFAGLDLVREQRTHTLCVSHTVYSLSNLCERSLTAKGLNEFPRRLSATLPCLWVLPSTGGRSYNERHWARTYWNSLHSQAFIILKSGYWMVHGTGGSSSSGPLSRIQLEIGTLWCLMSVPGVQFDTLYLVIVQCTKIENKMCDQQAIEAKSRDNTYAFMVLDQICRDFVVILPFFFLLCS